MKIREYLNEMMQGRQMDKLVQTLLKAKGGMIKEAGMIGLGFNLRSAAANNESEIVKTMAERLNLKMTEQDLRQALKEVGVKSVADIVVHWNKGKAAASRTRTASTRLMDTKKRQF